jgi:thiamine pyrophosphate-dependent acetolactate synthase large subunit-like protein
MNGAELVATILKAEGTRQIIGFPHSELFDSAAALEIRPIITRTERVAINIAEGFARMTDGGDPAVVTVQYGPGAENAFGGVAQAYNDHTPLLFLPTGYQRGMQAVAPNFDAARNYRHVTKWSETALRLDQLPQLLRYAFSQLRNGGPGPVLLELPTDLLEEQLGDDAFDYRPPRRAKPQADPAEVRELIDALLRAKEPVIMAGQGVLSGQAWSELVELAELLQIPVMTTPNGKSAFPENHALALGTAGKSRPATVDHFLKKSDLLFAIGTSLTRSLYVTPIPKGKTIIQATIDASDLGKDYPIELGVVSDARSILWQMIEEAKRRPEAPDRRSEDGRSREVQAVRTAFMKEWLPLLHSDESPLSPYRVIWELGQTIDRTKAVVTHDAGHPRDQVLPFYESLVPKGYIGWGKTTQLGTGLGLTIGARLARPDWLAVALMGEAAFGMVGMDLETAARCALPVLIIVLRNGIMGGYGRYMPVATARYKANRLSGDYAIVAKGLGCHAESVARPEELRAALQRCLSAVAQGRPALLEAITHEEARLPGLT